jgi:hypothetical protein
MFNKKKIKRKITILCMYFLIFLYYLIDVSVNLQSTHNFLQFFLISFF